MSDAQGLPTTLEGRTPAWEVNLGTHQYSIPSIDRGCVYLGVNDFAVQRAGYRPSGGGALLCLELATGAIRWTLPVPRFAQGTQAPYYFDHWRCGICSGPVIAGDRVYSLSNRGEVLCLDRDGQADGNDGPFLDEVAYMGLSPEGGGLRPSDGDILWRFDLLETCGVIPHDTCGSTLLLVDGCVYVSTCNGVNREHRKALHPEAPSLVVVDAVTGQWIAKDDEKIGTRIFHGNWSSPSSGVIKGKTSIFFGGGDGRVYAFQTPERDPGGGVQRLKKIWDADANPPHFREKDGVPVPYATWANKQPYGPCEPIGTPVFHEGRIFVAIGQSPVHGPGNGCVTCLDAETGKVLWRNEKVNRSLATVAIRDGILYLPDEGGQLHALDCVTGETLWTQDLSTTVCYANAFVADGKVYVGTEKGDFWILSAGREKKVLARSRLPSPPITVAATDGWLLIPMQNRLHAYHEKRP